MRITVTPQQWGRILKGILLGGSFLGLLSFLVGLTLFGRRGVRWEHIPQAVGGTIAVLGVSVVGVIVALPLFKAVHALVDSVGTHKVNAAVIATEERCPTRGALSIETPQSGDLSVPKSPSP